MRGSANRERRGRSRGLGENGTDLHGPFQSFSGLPAYSQAALVVRFVTPRLRGGAVLALPGKVT